MASDATARILVVDDDTLNRRILDEVLGADYTILEAKDGEQALKRVKADPSPDLILLDIVMPGLDGFDVVQALKEDPRTAGIPVIFITGKDSPEDEEKGLRLGAVDYITKPFNAPVVQRRVANRLELERNTGALREMNAQKDRFFSMIAHDLKYPFGPLVGFATEMQRLAESDEQEPEKIAAYAGYVLRAADQAQKLVEDLLDWSRVQLDRMDLDVRACDVLGAIESTTQKYGSVAEEKNIALEVTGHTGAIALADGKALEAVLRNLVSNAIKFTKRDGRVTLNVLNGAGEVVIEVSDTGTGIPDDLKDKLFELGAYTSTAGTEGEEGTGLGLILCWALLEKQGGHLSFESTLGEGTTFRITLPADKP